MLLSSSWSWAIAASISASLSLSSRRASRLLLDLCASRSDNNFYITIITLITISPPKGTLPPKLPSKAEPRRNGRQTFTLISAETLSILNFFLYENKPLVNFNWCVFSKELRRQSPRRIHTRQSKKRSYLRSLIAIERPRFIRRINKR